MPKIQEFDINSFTDSDYKTLLAKQLEEKVNKLNIKGATIYNQRIHVYNIKISDEDLALFKKSEEASKMLKSKHEEKKKKNIEEYNKIKKKCDYCLYDVRAYNKLLESIDEFSYCGATSELKVLEKRYIKSSGPTKALYRARAQEFSKIKC